MTDLEDLLLDRPDTEQLTDLITPFFEVDSENSVLRRTDAIEELDEREQVLVGVMALEVADATAEAMDVGRAIGAATNTDLLWNFYPFLRSLEQEGVVTRSGDGEYRVSYRALQRLDDFSVA